MLSTLSVCGSSRVVLGNHFIVVSNAEAHADLQSILTCVYLNSY